MTLRWTLDDLRVFCAVADEGTMTAAAQSASLSLPAVSARLKSLEDAFGAPLCERSNKGVTLTPAGRRLLSYARELLERAAVADEDVSEFSTRPRGLIRIAANTTAVTEHLPEALGAFLVVHPLVNIALTESISAEVLRQVRDGQSDIGIFTPSNAVTDLQTFPFREDKLVLIVSETNVWASRLTMAFEETLSAHHVGLQREAAMLQFLAQRARDLGRVLKGRIHVASFDTIARLVEQGVGVAVIPLSSARRLQAATRIRVVELSDAWAANPLNVCCRSSEELSPAARAMLEVLVPGSLQES